MLERLIDFSIRRRAATLVATACFALFGVYTLSRLKIESFPDVTNVQVMVITLVPGQAAEEVEKRVTIPVERALTNMPNVLGQRSITSFGLSQVIVTFEDGTDIYFARQQVAERLPDAEVPEGVTPTLGPNDTPVGQVYQYTLESDHHSPSELRGWQDWVVSRQLMRVQGVADVVSFGGFQKEYHVLADPLALRANGLGLDDLIDAVNASNAATSGGYLRTGEAEFVVRGRGYLNGPEDVEKVVLKAERGTPILVRNVAKVVEGYTPRRGAVARGPAIDSVEGTILLRRGENPKDVLDAVHLAIDEVNLNVLPKGMRIVPFYDRTRLVNTTLDTVAHNMLEGATLVALVLFVFLRAVSGSIAVAVTMPLALCTAFIGLYYSGVPANLLSMGAIDFGILLDGAVVLVENAYHLLGERQPKPHGVPVVIAQAAKEVVRPTLFSMSIIAAAMLPIFTLQRVEGRIFRPMALTYAFALAGSLFFMVTCVPALTTVLLKNRKVAAHDPGFLIFLRKHYLAALRLALRLPWLMPLIGLCVLGAAGAMIPLLGTEFLPEMNEGDIHITVTMPSSVSLDRGAQVLREIRITLMKYPEVRDVLTEQGHPEDGTDDEAPNQAETFVMLKPPETWRTGRSKEQLVEAMRAELQKRLGIEYNFSQPIKDRVEESISGIRGQIVVKIYGIDLNLMHQKLDEVRRVLNQVQGSRDVEVYRAGASQHVVADIDRDATARMGIPVRDVEDVIESAFGGKLATQIWEGERKVGVRIKLPTPADGDAFAVGRLEIPIGATRLPLASLSNVHQDLGRTQINREQGGRFLAIKCNIEGRDMGSFVAEAQARVSKQIKIPEGYYITWGGEFENQRRAMARLSIIVPISVAVIFFLLFLTFGSALPAVVVLLDVPFAAVGGVFALYFTHTVLSVSAAVGFITLFGVAVMDGVLLVTYIRTAMQQFGSDSREAIVEAVSRRLRPVLMTALLAALGLLPAATSHAIGSDTQRPFAIVIISGLVSSTLLTLLLLPTLYALADRWFGTGRKRPRAAAEPEAPL
ncbi:MAG: efflux RND transporter permease subunit [Polyangiales bacterium]